MRPSAVRRRSSGLIAACLFCGTLLMSQPSAAAEVVLPQPAGTDVWTYHAPWRGVPRLQGLPEILEEVIGASDARWGIAVRDLTTGETVGLNLTERFAAASLYKLGVLLEVLQQQLVDGRLQPEQLVVLSAHDVDPVWGGSVLSAGTVLSINEALDWMITRSDNGAAIALVRTVGGGHVVNARFRALGMWQSAFDDPLWTSPADQLTLFTALAEGRAVSSEASAAALQVLARQQITDRIPRGLPVDRAWTVAHKTGDDVDVIADSGIVATPSSTYVLSLIANRLSGNQTRALFASISALVYAAFATDSINSEFESNVYRFLANGVSLGQPTDLPDHGIPPTPTASARLSTKLSLAVSCWAKARRTGRGSRASLVRRLAAGDRKLRAVLLPCRQSHVTSTSAADRSPT
jgi:beta-lactamase class A